jgi:hypothetical protein
MGRTPWATYLWPGLAQLWRRGSWLGLAVAVGFALLLNLAILATLFWIELLSARVRTSVYLGIAVFWVGSAVVAYHARRRSEAEGSVEKDEDGLRAAIEQYLKGNWFETERALESLLRRNPRDIEAGLMWATLMRRQGRLHEAVKELDRIERFEGHQKWELEIRRERELLNGGAERTADSSGPAVPESSTTRAVDAA